MPVLSPSHGSPINRAPLPLERPPFAATVFVGAFSRQRSTRHAAGVQVHDLDSVHELLESACRRRPSTGSTSRGRSGFPTTSRKSSTHSRPLNPSSRTMTPGGRHGPLTALRRAAPQWKATRCSALSSAPPPGAGGAPVAGPGMGVRPRPGTDDDRAAVLDLVHDYAMG